MPRDKTVNALIKAGFLPFETKEMSRKSRLTPGGKLIKVTPLTEHLDLPYIKNMIRERARASRRAKKAGLSRRGYTLMIKEDLYELQGYLDNNRRPDFWALLRAEREKALEAGDYFTKKRPPRLPLTKADIIKGTASGKQRVRGKSPASEFGEVFFNEQTGKFEARFYKPD